MVAPKSNPTTISNLDKPLLSLDLHPNMSQSTKSHTHRIGIPIWSNQLTQNIKISQISHKLSNIRKHTQLLLLLLTKLGIPFDLLAFPQNPTPLLLLGLSYPFLTKGFFPQFCGFERLVKIFQNFSIFEFTLLFLLYYYKNSFKNKNVISQLP